ncbi:MAG TPA: response regulator [Pyrinomonadaceae bacterium]|nr:response regulator [Pyrinomonadaceae bacterium]
MGHVKTVTSGHDSVHSSIELDVAPSIRILHIEDDETIATLAKEMFEEKGWQVHTCDHGNAAIEHISGAVHYDFLLFDYQLPGIDGLELVRRARKLVHRSRTPVGVLSATPIEAEAKEAGANVFLRKPQDIGSLAERISRLLREHRQ